MERPITYFSKLRKEPFKTTFPDFSRNYNALDNPSPIEEVNLLNFAASMASPAKQKKYFKNINESSQAYDFMVGQIWDREDKVLASPDSFSPICSMLSLKAYEALALKPSEKFVSHLMDVSLANMSRFRVAELVDAVHSLANLAIRPDDDWINAWWKQIKDNKDEVKGEQVAVMLRAMMMFDAAKHNDSGAVSENVPRGIANFLLNVERKNYETLLRKPNGGKTLLSQVYFAARWFDNDFVNSHPVQPEDNTTSRTEERVAKALGIVAKIRFNNPVVKATGHKIDLAFSFNRAAIGIEVDGKTHFLCDREDNMHYNGSSRMQTALTSKFAPELILLRLPGDLSNKFAQYKSDLRSLLNNVANLECGAYVVHAKDDIRLCSANDAWVFPRVSFEQP